MQVLEVVDHDVERLVAGPVHHLAGVRGRFLELSRLRVDVPARLAERQIAGAVSSDSVMCALTRASNSSALIFIGSPNELM